MSDASIFATLPRPRLKRIAITDPTIFLAQQIERTLLDTSLNKQRRIDEVIAICRAIKSDKRNEAIY